MSHTQSLMSTLSYPARVPSDERAKEVSQTRNGFLCNVQAHRFLAALMVLYAHLAHETSDHRIAGMHGLPPSYPLAWGTGVDVFFVVSGFIMYYLTADKFGKPGYWKLFLKRRLIRIVPLYWLFTALMLAAISQFVTHVHHADASLGRIFASLFFYPVARPDGVIQPILGLGWTLEYEMIFYACFTAALLFTKRIGLSVLIVGFVVLSIANRVIPSDLAALHFWTNPIIVDFPLGILLAHLYLRNIRIKLTTQIASIVLAFTLMCIMGHLNFLDRWIWAGLPAFVLSLGIILGPEWNLPAIILGGDASYAIYLSHPFTLNVVAVLWTRLHLPPSAALYVLVGGSLCVLAAVGVYRYIELPMLNALRRRFA